MNNHIHPNQEIDSELLSAYLDDELTANERLVVEQALENSPSLRESLEELKVLSNEIQQLAVEFHPNEQQMIDTVINNIRDRNLSVHGQAPYSNVKIPVLTKGWKQRLQIPALLTLTAGVLAILTLRFMPNEQSMTLVQTDTIAEI
ncbi:MAG: zf-HC2 domain-containing protein [Planctomycetaceae bacterium]|nr:zf-HC2 domain-containing protein [Planctomycetaceae bacterium]